MARKRRRPVDRYERREEALRPCRYLGYDRDALGMYLMSREAFEVAESQLRRAAWLNPYEPRFQVHLAWCLYKQRRLAEAAKCLQAVKTTELPEDLRATVNLIRRGIDLTPPGLSSRDSEDK